MQTLRFTAPHDQAAQRVLVGALAAGAVAVMPTDTVYGLCCRADDARAIKRIYRLKKRTDPKLPLLVSSMAMAKRYVRISKHNEALLRNTWPAALTAILPSKKQLPYILEGGTDTLSMRIPVDDRLRAVIRRLGVPLVATSANIAGEPTVETEEQLRAQFKRLPDVFVDGGKPRSKQPSTLVDLTGEEAKVLRQGAVRISNF